MESRDIPPVSETAPEPIWERRRREKLEVIREFQQSQNRGFAHRFVSGIVTLTGLGIGMVAGGLPDGARFTTSDYAFLGAFTLFSAASVWLVTRIDRTRPASGIWVGMGGFLIFGIALTLALPFLDPVLAKLFP